MLPYTTVPSLLQTRRDFHVVMIDVIMPEMRGDTLLPMVRRLLGDHVAVIMISTLGDMGLIQRCLFSGACIYMYIYGRGQSRARPPAPLGGPGRLWAAR